MNNIELLPKHTNSLTIKEDTKIQPYKKLDAIIIPERATNGDMFKVIFPNCRDWKARIEGDGGEVNEVHFVLLR